MRHIILISGKDSAATAIVQKTLHPELEYTYIHNDTLANLPETDAWLDRMEAYLGFPIKRVGKNLEEQILEYGILPTFQSRFCTRKTKIEPLEAETAGQAATVYYGLRADEPDRVGYVPTAKTKHITPAFPLREAQFDLRAVWAMLDRLDLLPPAFHWDELHDAVVGELGVDAWMVKKLLPWHFRSLFAWRSRLNCYFCFNQAFYEWIGLATYHPDLFERSLWFEDNVGAKGFGWNAHKSLRQILSERDRIVAKRARAVAKVIRGAFVDGVFKEDISAFERTSCGLLCGK